MAAAANLTQAPGGVAVPQTPTATKEIPPTRGGYFKTDIVWPNVIVFVLAHIASVYASYLFIFKVCWMTKLHGIFCFILVGQGLLVGGHRYYAHKTFKATTPLRLLMMIFFTLVGQNCALVWARDHRVHHKYSDTSADPHDSSRGLFFSHVGWLLIRKLPEVRKRTREMDVSDLDADPFVKFQEKYYYLIYFAGNYLLMLVPVYAWGESAFNSFMVSWLLRTVLMLHATWSVNSFAHHHGDKPYDTRIRPVQVPWLSAVAGGEGWHNYHHAFPHDYKASEVDTPCNTTARVIEFFAKIGWAYDLREASDTSVVSRMQKKGDGSTKHVGRTQWAPFIVLLIILAI